MKQFGEPGMHDEGNLRGEVGDETHDTEAAADASQQAVEAFLQDLDDAPAAMSQGGTTRHARRATNSHAALDVPPKELTTKLSGLQAPLVLSGMTISEPLILCAEPDMGKSHAAHWIMSCARNLGWQVHQYACDALSGDREAKRVGRIARKLGKRLSSDQHALVVFDGITPGDEFDAASMARALERLHAQGAQILVCLRPEAEQLVDYLPSCVCMRTEELLYRFDDHECEEWELTGGIGPLVQSLSGEEPSQEASTVGTRYLLAMEPLIDHLLRPALAQEDLRLRLAALLLGSGTMGDLALVAGRCDLEQFAWLGRDVALADVDCPSRRFFMHGLNELAVLRLCLSTLQRHAAQHPHLVLRASGLLARRGDVRRSAEVCSLCSSESDFVEAGTAWGTTYVNAGEVALVTESLRTMRSTGLPLTARAQMSEVAVYALNGTEAQFDAACQRMRSLMLAGSVEQRLYDQTRLFGACREVWRNPRRTEECLGVAPDDALALRGLEHLRAVRLLVEGRLGEAYSLISNEMALSAVEGVVTALLYDDLRIALLLSGGTPDARERTAFVSATRFFEGVSVERLQCYHRALTALPEVLMGLSDDMDALEDASNRADRAGDTYLHGLCLAAMAVADMRLRAWPRAHVRAERVARLAEDLKVAYLASAAGLLDALALEMLGEHGALGTWCTQGEHPGELMLLGKLAARQMGELAPLGLDVVIPVGMPCPRDALWLLGLLAFDCQAFSETVAEAMPSSWLEQVRAIRVRQRELVRDSGPNGAGRSGARATTGRLERGAQTQFPLQARSLQRVQVKVLGGFSAEVDGTALPESAFERRRSRDLMVLLAIVPGHRLRRYQAIDILWPDCDYFRGPRKLYEATGEIRKQLAHRLGGLNTIVADRMQGTVGFDLALVGTDVDEFEREARMALTEDRDDFWVLDHARRMERIYASGPDPHLRALGERVVERIDELESLFVDATIAAGEAALRLGKTKLAVRYASDAHRLRELREDAMILLVEALRAAGRGFEVPALYRRYARRLIEKEGVAPSLALRRAVSLISDDGPEALTA